MKCEHGMMLWECFDCDNKAKLKRLKAEAKKFIDANVWDGEDRSGAKNDRAIFDPDDLQELIDDLVEHLHNK